MNSGKFEHGHPRYGGRQAGTPNKSNVLALVKDRFPDFHPILAMIEMYHDPATQPELKKNLLSEIASYMIPKVKPVEFTELRRVTDEAITALVSGEREHIDTFIEAFLNGRLSAQDLSSLVAALSLKQQKGQGTDEQAELLSLIKRR